jgi:tetratricopeptide (TPR) repeat protein
MNESYQPGTLAPLIPDKKKPAKIPVSRGPKKPDGKKLMPLIPEPEPVVIPAARLRNPWEVALLNLSGLGLGYAVTTHWVRFAIHLAVTIGLVVTGFASKAHTNAALWIIIFILWLGWMVFDGWNITQRTIKQANKANIKLQVIPTAIGIAALILMVGGMVAYSLLASANFVQAMKAYNTSDCAAAQPLFKKMSSIFELTFSPKISLAELKIEECSTLLAAEEAESQGNYSDVIDAYKGYLNQYPNNPPSDGVREKIAATYFAWGNQLLEQEKYQEALDTYDKLLQEYPLSKVISQVPAAEAATLLKWAEELSVTRQFAASIEKYKEIITSYASSPSAATARTQIVKTYASWAGYLSDTGKFEDAINMFELLQEKYSQTTEGQTAPLGIALAHIAWGKNLIQNGDFYGAMDQFDQAKQTSTDASVQDLAEQGYTDALNGLAYDKGEQGTQIIETAQEEACAGIPASSPAVGIGKDIIPGKALNCSYGEVSLPSDLTAYTPAEFLYVIKFSSDMSAIETCPYEGGYSITRYQNFWTVTVISTNTGRVVYSHQFAGSSPDSCPDTHWFTIGAYNDSMSGGDPDDYAVEAWLRQVIK